MARQHEDDAMHDREFESNKYLKDIQDREEKLKAVTKKNGLLTEEVNALRFSNELLIQRVS